MYQGASLPTLEQEPAWTLDGILMTKSPCLVGRSSLASPADAIAFGLSTTVHGRHCWTGEGIDAGQFDKPKRMVAHAMISLKTPSCPVIAQPPCKIGNTGYTGYTRNNSLHSHCLSSGQASQVTPQTGLPH
ncbi:MAG: hypothetical protein FRX48_09327 [Lasallia pustulata]|uniref:Uncharacterized protein n=1 Tax=Lasallia pustulata TaxID=136370 RepID=A0A5M8PC04_9LECA|nr:MAG: hypothetical protein FRX48_09327 [Lasallia pustulata]